VKVKLSAVRTNEERLPNGGAQHENRRAMKTVLTV